MHKPEAIRDKVIWGFNMQTDPLIPAEKKRNVMKIHTKKRPFHLLEFSVPADVRGEI